MANDPRVTQSFPPYVYQEFPKWVEGPDGPVLVYNQTQELDIKVSRTDQITAPPKVVQENIQLAQQLSEAQATMASLKAELDALRAAGAAMVVGQAKAPAQATTGAMAAAKVAQNEALAKTSS